MESLNPCLIPGIVDSLVCVYLSIISLSSAPFPCLASFSNSALTRLIISSPQISEASSFVHCWVWCSRYRG
ncbi:hypothetical protein M413DRAFT_345928 [Hebeloma cylindrosporum]|uniref:Uncharacterized protein n=1 Tax=Hebeloma cylindrosporum TaxID=76867 RepID=A0A0C3CNP9_HEBCY|nr:hypothetical protein M413DRAFT_345928 [Hebeloma cylindrosporum h7]